MARITSPRVRALTSSVVAPVVDWTRRVSRSLGTGGAFDNVARRVEEERVARAQVELLARRLAHRSRLAA